MDREPDLARTLYDVLGVSETFVSEDVLGLRRILARRLHPDHATGDASRMKEINDACDVLGDSTQRARYDERLREARARARAARQHGHSYSGSPQSETSREGGRTRRAAGTPTRAQTAPAPQSTRVGERPPTITGSMSARSVSVNLPLDESQAFQRVAAAIRSVKGVSMVREFREEGEIVAQKRWSGTSFGENLLAHVSAISGVGTRIELQSKSKMPTNITSNNRTNLEAILRALGYGVS